MKNYKISFDLTPITATIKVLKQIQFNMDSFYVDVHEVDITDIRKTLLDAGIESEI